MNLTLSDSPETMLSPGAKSALRALHRALISTRAAASHDMEPKRISALMDTAEYLANLIINDESRPESEWLAEFRLFLEHIQTTFPGFDDHLLEFFDNSQTQSPNYERETIDDQHQARVAV